MPTIGWRHCSISTAMKKESKSRAQPRGQNLNIRKGRTLVSQLVAAGEFPVQIDAHHHEAVSLRQAGAPIDYIFPEPFIPVKSVSAFVMSSQPAPILMPPLYWWISCCPRRDKLAFRQKRWPAFQERRRRS